MEVSTRGAVQPHAPASPLDLTKLGAVLGMAGAAAVLGLNVMAGALFIRDCRIEGGRVGECWDRGLSISGLGSGGPLAAAFGIGGYVIGQTRGRSKGYEEGYWTINPELRQGETPLPGEALPGGPEDPTRD
jgi:hypothetical protein